MREGGTPKTHNNTKGLVRAFNVHTGQLLWTFNTIPRPGEFGNDTWLNNSWAVNGNTGVWTQISVDEDLGLVYLPIETTTSDYYGGHRPGNKLFARSPPARVPPCSARASSPSTSKPVSGSGTTSSFTIRSGTSTTAVPRY